MSIIDSLRATLAPITRGLIAPQFGCLITILRKTEGTTADGGVMDVYAADATATNIGAILDNSDADTREKKYGFFEGSTAILLIPPLVSGLVSIAMHDGIRIETGPYAGTTFLAETKGAPGVGVFTIVPLSEAALVLA